MPDDCLFCKIASGEMDAEIVHQDDDVVAFEDINPQAPTHVLVIPRKHVPTVNELEAADDELLGKMARTASRVAEERGLADRGYRLVLNCKEGAGQSVFHIHMHMLGGRALSWPPG